MDGGIFSLLDLWRVTVSGRIKLQERPSLGDNGAGARLGGHLMYLVPQGRRGGGPEPG